MPTDNLIRLTARRTDPEAALWRWVRPQLAPYGTVHRVENPLDPGMPDVNYCLQVPDNVTPVKDVGGRLRAGLMHYEHTEGWLELKYLGGWPRCSGDPVGPDLLRPAQRAWLLNRTAAGGAAWVLVRVDAKAGREHWLWRGTEAARQLGRCIAGDFYRYAMRLEPGTSLAEALRW